MNTPISNQYVYDLDRQYIYFWSTQGALNRLVTALDKSTMLGCINWLEEPESTKKPGVG